MDSETKNPDAVLAESLSLTQSHECDDSFERNTEKEMKMKIHDTKFQSNYSCDHKEDFKKQEYDSCFEAPLISIRSVKMEDLEIKLSTSEESQVDSKFFRLIQVFPEPYDDKTEV